MREPIPPMPRLAPRNGAGVAALTLGAVALVLVLTVLLFPLGGLLGIAAILLGLVGIGRVARWRAFNRGQAVAGLVLGGLALLLSAALALRLDGSISKRAGDLARLDRCLFTAASSRAAAGCATAFAHRMVAGTAGGELGAHASRRVPDHRGRRPSRPPSAPDPGALGGVHGFQAPRGGVTASPGGHEGAAEPILPREAGSSGAHRPERRAARARGLRRAVGKPHLVGEVRAGHGLARGRSVTHVVKAIRRSSKGSSSGRQRHRGLGKHNGRRPEEAGGHVLRLLPPGWASAYGLPGAQAPAGEHAADPDQGEQEPGDHHR